MHAYICGRLHVSSARVRAVFTHDNLHFNSVRERSGDRERLQVVVVLARVSLQEGGYCFSGWHVLHQSGRKDTHERGPYLCDWSKFETSYFQSRGLSEETTLLGGTFLFSDFAGTRRRPERNPTSRKWQLATWHTCKDAGSSSGPSCCVIAIARRTNMNVRDFELWARSNGFNALRVSRSTDRDETPANIGPKHRHARNLTLLERDVRAQIKDER